jgi:hypothetical protein
MSRFCDPVVKGGLSWWNRLEHWVISATQGAQRWAELLERVTATGSLVIRKLGATRAGELAIHRFLSAPSVSCREMLATLAGSTLAATARRHIVVAQDTTEINFAGRGANRSGLGAAGDGVSAGFFIHPLVAIDSETEAVLGLLDAQIWTRDDEIEAAPRRQRAIEDKESMRWLRGVGRRGSISLFVRRKTVRSSWRRMGRLSPGRCSPAQRPGLI